ncbi:plasma membrane ascorbate-dependent reductase CYBRD1 isoform X3 [Cherax quadricarinatus]|uniref:plasma membrane ascorbate-dependent reductase CYBRD1 isoform X3 n=1 Tax=Cherax quadricarinatus TaxID=27406 RepID=UPI002378B39E|nr:plasma membrane ascorbate-dependent reductase CYBRD1-like isoform X3 [Cherax quadricarinatus]
MLSIKKDSTISSKLSEYDNVPVLPGDYHNHVNHDDLTTSSTHLSGFLLDDPPPVPPHQAPLSNTTLQRQQESSPQHHSSPQHQQLSPQHKQSSPQHQESPPQQRPLQFPTDDNQLELLQDQQKLQQDEYGSCIVQYQQQQHLQQRGTSASSYKTHQQTRERTHRDSYGGEMSTSSSLIFYCLVFLAEILMFGLLSLVLFWVVYYRGGFAWREDVTKEFNYHPVLMICGFVFFMGHAMLVYRLFRCCNKLTAKILHTFLYLMAVPCIVVATITVFDSHNLRSPPIPNLYSLHSWLGVITIGLFALQVTHTLVVGFFSFWLLLCCEQGTVRFRSGLVPVHATFGIITFMLAIATAVTGYTEKAFFSLRDPETKEIIYSRMENEAIIINTQAAALAALGILVPLMIALRPFRRRWSDRLTEHL